MLPDLLPMRFPAKRIQALLALIPLLLSAAPAMAQVSWRMATEYPQNNISGIGLSTFAERVAARTNGFVTVANAFDNELKINSGEMPRAAADGRITGGDAFAGALSGLDPVLALSTLPFLVQSVDVARITNLRARPLYAKALAARGLKLLYVTIWPATGLWSDHALADADDLPKLNMRAYDANSGEVMRAAGANAQYLPMDAALAGLREHRLNAFLTSGDGGAGRKLWDFLPNFTAINYAMPVSIAFVRSDAFAELSEPMQHEVLAAAAETEQSQFALLAHRTAENYARMRDNGVRIAEPAPAPLVGALRTAATGTISTWETQAGADATAIVEWVRRQ
ncbi:TRAP transporter substrate-binding protein [Bradyrhizobium diazoefficiens]|jgi:TRAP-type C4-dicarboxylate transport system substrate-binding protein|nr:TRAP transporter substrate-binding protein [Bradyrhizobium diazoefficiens]UCF52931.1 MAG: TRAP transporter substrate-binding protein [Bradyrhizobium sp.]MBR0968112.1 TRAP transporter substrate-binding protein [Bradyrhizobium diazoefficiens]MBR0981509.1 TRAP transporter substrate-binding protein [Bradyrhizobium diazoefficiens]MBR1010962.1 TRAP transporter substrate-binding protein [Bradyrhizobium diazoefficiens]MBR1017462.1 TRAP transporter substrate-binding protein [Bradyrhizobium diazoeffi